MRIGLQTWGSDGDILPFIALSHGLAEAGHRVTLAYTSVDGREYPQLTDRLRIQPIKTKHVEVGSKDLYALSRWSDKISQLRTLINTCYDPVVDDMYAASMQLCLENDLVIGHTLCHTLRTASDLCNCPRVALALVPMVIRTEYAPPVGINLGKWMNRLLWAVGDRMMTRHLFRSAVELRHRSGLSPIRSLQRELFTSDVMTLVASSMVLCPRPIDWGESIVISGFLDLPATKQMAPPMELDLFMVNGTPPVYITFGSCMQFDAERNAQLLKEAAALTDERFIIQSDVLPIGTDSVQPNIFWTGRTDHSSIFPRCKAVVHHGGAGTSQAALLAGRPSVVVAHAYDQPYWATVLKKAGVAGMTLHRSTITPRALATEINNVTSSSELRQKAEWLGSAMRTENGVANAVKAIEQLEPKLRTLGIW